MEIRDIVSWLDVAKIKYPNNFINIEKEGCIDTYESLLQSNLKRIEEMVKYGINNGFSNKLKDNIIDLVKLTCNIPGEIKTKNYNKYETSSNSIYNSAKKEMKLDGEQIDMVEKVNTYIDSYILGMDVMLEEAPEDRKPILQEAIAKFNQLKSILSSVGNNSTAKALEFAKAIIEKLKSWSVVVSSKMYDRMYMPTIDDALKLAEEWKNNQEIAVKDSLFSRGNRVKDISELNFVIDNLVFVGKSRNVKTNIITFQRNLDEYKKGVVDTSNDYVEQDLNKLKEERARLQAEADDIKAKFENGLITDVDAAAFEHQQLTEEIEEITEEINSLYGDYRDNRSDSRLSASILRQLNSVNNEILRYGRDRAFLGCLGDILDFAKLTNVMGGICEESDIEYVLGVRQQLDAVKEMKEKTERKVKERLESIKKVNAEKLNKSRLQNGEQVKTHTPIVSGASYFQSLSNKNNNQQTVTQTTQTQETVEEQNIRIVLNDEDL